MDSNELIQIARECGAVIDVLCMGRHDNVVFTSGELQQFAQRIRAAALREAADVCELISDEYHKNESQEWAELKTDAESGASVCASRLLELAEGNP